MDLIIKNLFVNRNSQIRSGWKIALTLAAYIITAFIMTGLSSILYVLYGSVSGKGAIDILSVIGGDLDNDQVFTAIRTSFITIGAVAVVILMWMLLDKQPASALGFTNIKKGSAKLLTGFAAGAVSMCMVFAVLMASGSISLAGSLTSPNITPSLFWGLIAFIGVGISEEAFSRGYCMSVLKQTGSLPVIILAPSFIFSLLHLANPNVSLVGISNIFLVGVLLSLMFLRTGSLWMPIGYHIAWNYFQGTIFGLSVSGMYKSGMYTTKLTSESIINGGAFGPEGGLAVTFVLAAGIALEYYLSSREQGTISLLPK